MTRTTFIKVQRKGAKKFISPAYGVPVKNGYGIQFQDLMKQNETAMSHKETTTNFLWNALEEFTLSTSMHGFQYLLNKKYSMIERLWWLVMVFTSISVSGVLISQIWHKWNITPVVLNIDDIATSVWQIPFPAVTLCTDTKSRQKEFNFAKAFNERWSNSSTISTEDLKLYHDMLLICNNPYGDGPDFADTNSVETLRRVAPSREEIFLRCNWGNYTCDELFFQTLTKDGYCFTFNMFSREEMFRVENLHNDYVHTNSINKSSWSLSYGYAPNASLYTYPFRGLIHEFDITLLTHMHDLDLRCCGLVQGFKIWLHNPAELPNMGQNFFRLPVKYQSNVMITPKVTETSMSLRSYSPNKRHCYFTDERYLRFFRVYTENNCELECISNYTARRCNCVPLYMPHGPNTKICGGGKTRCVIKAVEELSLAHSELDGEVSKQIYTCGCLQACTELKYDAEVSQAVYDDALINNDLYSTISEGWHPSSLIINFAKEKSLSMRRSELYATVEFLAQCGGIMGLFIGFSILSLIETFFYFSLRLWCLRRKTYREIDKKEKKEKIQGN